MRFRKNALRVLLTVVIWGGLVGLWACASSTESCSGDCEEGGQTGEGGQGGEGGFGSGGSSEQGGKGGNATGGSAASSAGKGGTPAGGNGTSSGGSGTSSGGNAGSVPDAGVGGSSPDGGAINNDPKSKNWVFLLLGQSNMAGSSPMEKEDQSAPARVWKLSRDKVWVPGAEGSNINPYVKFTPTNYFSPLGEDSLSPSRTFAMDVLASTSDAAVNIYIVNAAVSGSAIESWEPGKGENYQFMLPYLEEAMKKGVVRGFLWHQGEANGGMASRTYADRLKAILAAIRAKVADPLLPMVAGQVGITADGNVNGALNLIKQEDARFGIASCVGLTKKVPGDAHYSSSSEREFGKRYAAAWLAIQSKP
ncbi:MAG: sialate O-acetylesterase [Deltaproteobacteria bacterium]|nr:sialate O-acetylesterase [Deltaproteobacteria bacterium]